MDGKEYGEIHVGMQAGRYSYTYRPKSPNVQHSHRCHTERQTVGQTDGRRHIGKDRDRDNDKDRGKDRDRERVRCSCYTILIERLSSKHTTDTKYRIK